MKPGDAEALRLAVGLLEDRLRQVPAAGLRGAVPGVLRPAVTALHALHSGHIGDYVAWLFAALAVLAGALGMQLG